MLSVSAVHHDLKGPVEDIQWLRERLDKLRTMHHSSNDSKGVNLTWRCVCGLDHRIGYGDQGHSFGSLTMNCLGLCPYLDLVRALILHRKNATFPCIIIGACVNCHVEMVMTRIDWRCPQCGYNYSCLRKEGES
jgi:hypothetical protein